MSKSVLSRADCSTNTLIYPGDDTDAEDKDIKNVLRENEKVKNNQQTATTTTAINPYFAGIARVAQFVDCLAIEAKLIER